jgi:hypothetical protein
MTFEVLMKMSILVFWVVKLLDLQDLHMSRVLTHRSVMGCKS